MKSILTLALFLGTLVNAQEYQRSPSYRNLTQEMLETISGGSHVSINGDECTVSPFSSDYSFSLNGRQLASFGDDLISSATSYQMAFWINYTDGSREHMIFHNLSGQQREYEQRIGLAQQSAILGRDQSGENHDNDDHHPNAPGSKRRRVG